MKRTFCSGLAALALVLGSTPAARAQSTPDPAMIVADVLIVRPVGVVVTAACVGVFIVALPFAGIANQVPQTAEAMVAKPIRSIFNRPLGDFTRMRNHSLDHTPASERQGE